MAAIGQLHLVDKRPRQRRLLRKDRSMQAALAARFTALGYYLAVDLELPKGYGEVADIAGIRPIMKELKRRNIIGPAPAGVLAWLEPDKWTWTEDVIEATESDAEFIHGVLMESEGKGWVEKEVVNEDKVRWRLKDYRYPARESFVAYCGSAEPLETFERLLKASDCCNLLYFALDYQVDEEFMDQCLHHGVGLLIYTPRNGFFQEVLPAEHREIKDKRGFMSLCEKVLFENYVLRRNEWL
jgi:hypothetical protein